MKRIALIAALLLMLCTLSASAEETVIRPQWRVPDHVTWLLEIAGGEVGYKEGAHGYSKYGEYWGDPYAQWCAEYLCWCVDQVDKTRGTTMLHNEYPLYSGQNTGMRWFIREGRFIARNGNLENWGYQWFRGEDEFIKAGEYIPQPGDWVFFTWTSDADTDHVAMVEYCTMDDAGNVTLHCLEGNNPNSVARVTYSISDKKILGYGTVHDVADWTMRQGNSGEKVRQLQEKLVYLGLMPQGSADGVFGAATAEAISAFQRSHDLRVLGIANIETQSALDRDYQAKADTDPDMWTIIEDEEWDD
ncbi:MAG: CHAP domain-containing protein [Clostridiales bacterium]|nr:CHAP domain-containing protein [Clostridiales bacterium]